LVLMRLISRSPGSKIRLPAGRAALRAARRL